ncbi:MAG: M23 family metallopeptidase [Candidatus Desulfofervidaceae bacterium]|nr:M23 family metallopeptidase [Candidatus Desulfofervidaceae bacterium]
MKSGKRRLFLGIVLVLLLGAAVILSNFLETSPPQIIFSPKPDGYLPASKKFTLTFQEKGRGLKEVEVFIEQDNLKHTIFKKVFPRTKDQEPLHFQTINITVTPKKLGVHDGPAVLVVYARDYSFWHWGKGNTAEVRYNVVVDCTPPTIEVLTRSHNISRGGSVLVIYRSPEMLLKHGVKAGDYFFHGYNWKGVYLCLFAYPYEISSEILYRIVCLDKAGNKGEGGFYYHIIPRKFKYDKLIISDNFLRAKMPEFWNIYPELQGKYLETFIKVNAELRAKSNKEIQKICQVSNPTPLWEGSFIRMKGVTRATFGDRRSYYYHGRKISKSIHAGVDIASIAHAPIPAANNGIVVYRGYLGIYGNAVIIDHGLGLFSLYGHLSSFQVKEGQQVKKGDIIGYTGATGLAGGDHLHFSMLVQGVFVNPVEWWDPHWLKNNITAKLRQVGLIK